MLAIAEPTLTRPAPTRPVCAHPPAAAAPVACGDAVYLALHPAGHPALHPAGHPAGHFGELAPADVVLFDIDADLAALPAHLYREAADRDPLRVAARVRRLVEDGWHVLRLVGSARDRAGLDRELAWLDDSGLRITARPGVLAVASRDCAGAEPPPRESMIGFTGLAG